MPYSPKEPSAETEKLQRELQALKECMDRAAMWKTAENDGNRYHYHTATKQTQWAVPDEVAHVRLPAFKSKMEAVQSRLAASVAAARAAGPRTPASSDAAAAELRSMSECIVKAACWQAFKTGEGATYYCHKITGQSQWEKPAEVTRVAEPSFSTRMTTLKTQSAVTPAAHHLAPPLMHKHVGPLPDTSKMLLRTEEEYRRAAGTFNSIVERKGLGKTATASYHATFAREIIGETAWHGVMRASGIDVLECSDGLPVDKIAPYAEAGKSTASVPTYKVIFQISPERSLTFEYTVKSNKAAIRGARSVMLEEMRRLVPFFGHFSEVSGPRAAATKAGPKLPPPGNAGHVAIEEALRQNL